VAKRIAVFALTLVFVLGAAACGGTDTSRIAEEAPGHSPEAPSHSPALNADKSGRCGDAEFGAILPYSQELQDSLTSVAVAADLQDLPALTEAGMRLVIAGADIQRFARDTSPARPD
jgi:hypothetical protein